VKLRLNKNRPYGELFGGEQEFPGAKFVQDNRYFRLDGTLIGDPIEVEPEVVTSTKPLKGTPEEVEWLQQQLSIYNEPFKSVAAARKFLAGKE
jgi:hypothetical protein